MGESSVLEQGSARKREKREGMGWSVQVLPADESGLQFYESFCSGARYGPTQSPLWARAWLHGAGENGILALVYLDDSPVLGLALEVEQKGSLRVARFAGGLHANGNFPCLHPSSKGADKGVDATAALLDGIRKSRPDIDMLALGRVLRSLEGMPNPLLSLPHTTSPNLALAADISVGFDQLFNRRNGSRRRRKHRYQIRKFEAAGGYRRYQVQTERDVDHVLDTFFRVKGKWLRDLGVPDTFASSHVRESFRRLFRSSLQDPSVPYALHTLEVGGKIRAITGSSRHGTRTVCDFGCFTEDELTKYAPGNFLTHKNIAEACAEGFTIYDLGVGDEPYKRTWCDIEIYHADIFVGLTVRGRLSASWSLWVARINRPKKQNAILAKVARRTRQLLGRK